MGPEHPRSRHQRLKTQVCGRERGKHTSQEGDLHFFQLSPQELPLPPLEDSGRGVLCGLEKHVISRLPLLNSLVNKIHSIFGLSFLQPLSIKNLA